MDQRPAFRAGRLRYVAMDLHRHGRGRRPDRGRRHRRLRVQGRQDPAEERVPQGPPQPACGSLRQSGTRHDDRRHRPFHRQRPGTLGAGLRPPLRPAGGTQPRHRPRLCAQLLGRERRPTAGGRWPGQRRHRCRCRDHRIGLDRHVHGALPRAGARHRGHGTRGQPGRLGLLQPQRRPGPERERPAEALAMDRALGHRHRPQARRRDPRRLRELSRPHPPDRLRSLRRRAPLSRASAREARGPRDRGPADARTVRLCHPHDERRGSQARLLRRARDGWRPVRAGGCRHSSAQVHLRLDAQGARARRQGASREPGAGLDHDRRHPPPSHARRHGAGPAGGGVYRRLHRAGAQPAAQEPADADPVELGGDPAADRCRAERDQLQVAHLSHRHADPALLLPAARRQSAPDRKPQLGERRGCRRPGSPQAAHRCDRPQVPALGRHPHRLLLVGLGRREPRHDAAHHPARSGQEHLVCGRLRRQRRFVLDLGRQAAGRAGGGQGWRAGSLRAADLPLAAAFPECAGPGRVPGLRAVPPRGPTHALQVVLVSRREVGPRAKVRRSLTSRCRG
ncbi:hypothetical protein VARIO8X_60363 [Burkholderiales bacterium 8X]|nr:hypothetical protein VARIO8X_60363 [Burkholderiales bacterium 8X]